MNQIISLIQMVIVIIIFAIGCSLVMNKSPTIKQDTPLVITLAILGNKLMGCIYMAASLITFSLLLLR